MIKLVIKILFVHIVIKSITIKCLIECIKRYFNNESIDIELQGENLLYIHKNNLLDDIFKKSNKICRIFLEYKTKTEMKYKNENEEIINRMINGINNLSGDKIKNSGFMKIYIVGLGSELVPILVNPFCNIEKILNENYYLTGTRCYNLYFGKKTIK